MTVTPTGQKPAAWQTLFAELKRRKVFRVAAVYGATSFVLLQAADLLFPRLGLPDWTVTLVVALALVGLPLALALAWAFEATQDGLRRTAPAAVGEIAALIEQPRARRWPAGLAALAGVALLVASVAWTMGWTGDRRGGGYDSIGVLPFANLSGDPANEYLGDGLAEELLNALAGIEGLKVAARTSAFAFKGASLDVRAIGDSLGVATVLEGSVRRSAEHIRITAQLIDAHTGYHVWSETYDRPLTELFAVQEAIASEIVNALAVRLTGSEKNALYRGGTQDVAAYDLYLLARQKWVTRQIPRLTEAVGLFHAAIARDSSFALAWSGLADALDALAWRSREWRDSIPRARYAAQRALVLEPELAEAWASLGVLALDFDRDWRFAELALRHAVELKPSYAIAHHWLGDVLRYSGRVSESLEPSLRAIELDPVSGMVLSGVLQTDLILGRFADARRHFEQASAVGWRDSGTVLNLISAGRELGLTPAEADAAGREWAGLVGYAMADDAALAARAIVDATLRARAVQAIDRMDTAGVQPRQLAELAVSLGEHERAITLLERAFALGEPGLATIGTDRAFDPLRADARFIRILEAMHLPNGIIE